AVQQETNEKAEETLPVEKSEKNPSSAQDKGTDIATEKTTDSPSQKAQAVSSPQKEEIENLLQRDFTFLNEKGEEVKLSDFLGKPIVLNFWASWCGPCKSEMPAFDKVYREKKEEVHFLLLNLTTALSGQGETPEKAKTFIESNGYSFPIYLDLKQEGSSQYGVMSIPTTFVLNAKGEIIDQHIGVMSEEKLLETIEKAKQ
ncbi:MAG: TlpA family protein disulfide reductase, partial [Clostridiales bacterium]|nr:TlpA family protein disulfide reductase [Clostridiales bacterium]